MNTYSEDLVARIMSQLQEKTKCNHSGAGTSCPVHGDADCNSSKQNRKEELMPEELVGTTYEAVLETGETILIEKEKGLDGKACWKGYKQMGTKKKGGKTVDNCVKAGYEPEGEELSEKKDMPGGQEKIDANKNGKVDAHDFALLRAKKGKKSVKEMWEITEAAKKKVEIEIMPEVKTLNDPEQGTGKKAKVKKEEVELEEKKLSKAEQEAKKEKFVKGMKSKFNKVKSKYGGKAQSSMFSGASKMAKA
jgi:hypothetical protein